MRYYELFENKIKMYHGTGDGPVKNFILGHTGNNSHTFGHYNSKRYGVFFTDNVTVANIYKNVHVYELNIDSTAMLDKLDKTYIIENFIDSIDPHGDERDIWLQAKYNKKNGCFLKTN